MTETKETELTKSQIEDIENVIESDEHVDEIIRRIELDDSIENLDFKERNPRSFSLKDHVSATSSATGQFILGFLSIFKADRVYPSHATVQDIEYEDGFLTLEMEAVGYDSTFSSDYRLPVESNQTVPEKTVALFDMVGADIHEPSTILEKKIPINYDDGYQVDFPQRQPGLGKWVKRSVRRVGRNYNLLKVKNGGNELSESGWAVLSSPVILGWVAILMNLVNVSSLVTATFFAYTVFHFIFYLLNIAD